MMIQAARSKIVALLSLLLLGACAASDVAPGPPLDSRARPPIELRFPRLGGGVVDLAQLRGRPVLLFFFATWSLRSQAEAAEIKRLADRYRHLSVVAVALEVDARELVRTYVDFVGFSFPVALVAPDDLGLISALGRSSKVPRSVLLDARGQLLEDHSEGQTNFIRLYEVLDRLMKGK